MFDFTVAFTKHFFCYFIFDGIVLRLRLLPKTCWLLTLELCVGLIDAFSDFVVLCLFLVADDLVRMVLPDLFHVDLLEVSLLEVGDPASGIDALLLSEIPRMEW